jgi:hypothetical protein
MLINFNRTTRGGISGKPFHIDGRIDAVSGVPLLAVDNTPHIGFVHYAYTIRLLSNLLLLPQHAANIAFCITLGVGGTFVVLLLPFTYTEQHLGISIADIHL